MRRVPIRALCVALFCVLLAACATPPVSDELLIEPAREDDTLVVTVTTKFELDPKNEQIRARIDAARAAVQSQTDPWSLRFGRLATPEEERVTWQKSRGALERVTRSARIPSDHLQHLLSDTNITVDALRGEDWRELTFYPGSGGRATREQQAQFDRDLRVWSESVARYFTAIHHLYTYLNADPQRAPYVFAYLLNEPEAAVLEEEQPLVDAVTQAMEEIAARMDDQEGRAATLAEQADLIFNPFPARIRIRTPSDVLATEGFTTLQGEVAIERVDLFAAIAELEGTWISPDPLAAILRDEVPSSTDFAKRRRQSQSVVTSSEIASSIRERLTRPRTYRVRWRG